MVQGMGLGSLTIGSLAVLWFIWLEKNIKGFLGEGSL